MDDTFTRIPKIHVMALGCYSLRHKIHHAYGYLVTHSYYIIMRHHKNSTRACLPVSADVKKGLFVFSLIVVLSLLFTTNALAWGPGVHMVTGNWILQNLIILPPLAAAVLMRFPGQFLHGCLSPDIFIGKGSRNKKGHSHNWESGFLLLANARSERERSYAYGYLAHLAADTVAHNVFVPYGLQYVPTSGKTAHIYLEMQADNLLRWDVSDALTVFHEAGAKKNSLLLQNTMQQRQTHFWIKKQVFKGSIYLGGTKIWRNSLNLFDHFLPGCTASYLDELLAVSTRAIVSVLQKEKSSPVIALDPIGAKKLDQKRAWANKPIPSSWKKNQRSQNSRSKKSVPPNELMNLPRVLKDLSPVNSTEKY